MSDEFGLSSDDEEGMLALMADGKRGHEEELEQNPNKRVKMTAKTAISPNTVLANKILQDRFGLNAFRLEQEAAITRILDGGSAVVVFPTGGGKSLCYQVSESNFEAEAKVDIVRFLLCVFGT